MNRGKHVDIINIIEGTIPGDKLTGRPCLEYIKQVTKGDSYTTLKRMTGDQEYGKLPTSLKD